MKHLRLGEVAARDNLEAEPSKAPFDTRLYSTFVRVRPPDPAPHAVVRANQRERRPPRDAGRPHAWQVAHAIDERGEERRAVSLVVALQLRLDGKRQHTRGVEARIDGAARVHRSHEKKRAHEERDRNHDLGDCEPLTQAPSARRVRPRIVPSAA